LQRRQHTGEDGEEQEEHGGGGEIVERGRHCTSSLRRWLACRVQSSWFMVSAQALLWGTDQGQSQHGGVFCVVVLYWKIFEQYNAFGEAAALNFFFFVRGSFQRTRLLGKSQRPQSRRPSSKRGGNTETSSPIPLQN
jgi:hypothetical protein